MNNRHRNSAQLIAELHRLQQRNAELEAAALAQDQLVAALHLSETRFRLLVEQSPLSTQIFAPDGRTLQVNHAWEQLWGVTIDQVRDYNILHDPQLVATGIMPFIQRGFAGEAVIIPPNRYDPNATLSQPSQNADPPRWVQAIIYPVTDQLGQLHEVVLIHEDITERQHADAVLRESEARYRTLVEHFPNGSIFLFDHDLRYTLAGGTGLAASGLTPEMFVGKTIWEIFPPEVAARDEPYLRAALAGQASHVEVPFGAQTYLVHTLPIRDAHGAVQGGMVMTQDMTERTRSQAAVQAAAEANAKFRTFFEQGSSFAGLMDVEGTVVEANRLSLDAAGFTRAEIIGKKFWDCGWWNRSPALMELVRAGTRQAAAGRLFRQETPYFVADGTERWVDLVITPVLDAAGNVLFLAPTGTDITDRKQTEDDTRFLVELSDRLRVNTAPEALLATVAQLTRAHVRGAHAWFVEVDAATERWALLHCMDTCPPTLNGGSHLAAYPPGLDAMLRSGAVATIEDLTDGGDVAAATRDVVPDGTRAVVIVPLLRSGRCVAALVVTTDAARDWHPREVTLLQTVAERTWTVIEQLRLDAAHRDYATRLTRLTSASIAIQSAPTPERVREEAATAMRTLIDASLGIVHLVPDSDWSHGEGNAAQPPELNTAADPVRRALLHLAHHVFTTQQVLRLTPAELERLPEWTGQNAEADQPAPLGGLLAAPIINHAEASVGVILLAGAPAGKFTATDEAVLRQLTQVVAVALDNHALYDQEQRARAQAEEASRLKDDFLATVSHELRTPLTAILGYAQLLRTGHRDAAYTARALDRVLRSARAQAELIDDLLDVSRIVSGTLRIAPERTDLIPVIEAALDTVRPAVNAKQIQLHVDLDPAASSIIGDAARLQQVVWNLVSNAAKFTPAGGAITVRLAPRNGYAELRISDTGQGIDAAFLPHVFDRFRQAQSTTTRAFGGLGLGLAIVRHLVELHGGTIFVTSAGEGQGATFTVRLPLAVGSPATGLTGDPRNSAVLAGCPPELAGLRVLVVDDQPDIVELIQDILVPCGAVVRGCERAQEALELVHAWQPDVLVSDLAMPEHDGYWLINAVRALAPVDGGTVPAVALTAYVRLADRERVLKAGFQQYVPKPVEPAELRVVLASVAHEAGARP